MPHKKDLRGCPDNHVFGEVGTCRIVYPRRKKTEPMWVGAIVENIIKNLVANNTPVDIIDKFEGDKSIRFDSADLDGSLSGVVVVKLVSTNTMEVIIFKNGVADYKSGYSYQAGD